MVSRHCPLSTGGLSLGPIPDQHWLWDVDWQSLFQSQETSITQVSAQPAALAGQGWGVGVLATIGLFLFCGSNELGFGVCCPLRGRVLSHSLASCPWGWGSRTIYHLTLGPPHSVTVSARLLKACGSWLRTPHQAPGICLVIPPTMELRGLQFNALLNWEGSVCEYLTSLFLQVETAACFPPRWI